MRVISRRPRRARKGVGDLGPGRDCLRDVPTPRETVPGGRRACSPNSPGSVHTSREEEMPTASSVHVNRERELGLDRRETG